MRLFRPVWGLFCVLALLVGSLFWQGCGSGQCTRNDECGYGQICDTGRCRLDTKHECWTDKECESKGKDFHCRMEPTSWRHLCLRDSEPSTPAVCKDPCVSDSDCSACENNKTSCVSGTCSVGSVDKCQSCAADIDCASCAAGNKCIDSKCQNETPPQCPASCQADPECSKCSGGQTSCKDGRCQKPTEPQKCPAQCTANVECAFCTEGRNTCLNGTCINLNGTCPNTCVTDKECDVDVCGTRRSCVSGKCASKTPTVKKPGEPCDVQTPYACGAELFCFKTSTGSGVCYQRCPITGSGCQFNTDGRTSCGEIAPTPPTFACVRVVPIGKGCGHVQQAICQGGQTPPVYCSPDTSVCTATIIKSKEGDVCAPTGDPRSDCDKSKGLACVNGKCVCPGGSCNPPPGTAGLYDKCGGATGAKCQSNLLCTILDPNVKEGYCLEKCDPNRPICSDGTCTKQANGTAVCIPGGLAGADRRCSGNGRPQETCRKGLVCIQFSQQGDGLCLPMVRDCSSNPCAGGRLCVAVTGGQGVCLNDCSQADNCPKPDTQCTVFQNNSKICAPAPEVGPVGFGGVCKQPAAQFGCSAGLQCLQSSQQAQGGFCTTDCTATNKCPSYTNAAGVAIAAKCLTISGGGKKSCLFSCGNPGEICPDGLTCTSIPSGDKFCLVQ